MRLAHWQDLGSVGCQHFGSLTVGAWLCVSPLVLSMGGVSAWVTPIFGLTIILSAIERLIVSWPFEELFEAIMSIALMVAPWSLGYESAAAIFNSMACGALVGVFSASEICGDQELLTWLHEHWPGRFA
jgi:hypothetical protein